MRRSGLLQGTAPGSENMSYTESGYRRFIRGYLESCSTRVVEQFRRLFERPLHPDVTVVDIEVFPEVAPAARMFLMNQNNTEVFGDSEEFLTSSIEVLSGSSRSEEGQYDAFVEAGVEVFEINVEETVAWLARCWERAGEGWPGVPAYISPHDDIRSFNLREKRWTGDREDKYRWFMG